MALGIYFSPESFPADKYDEGVKALEAAGAGSPPGRLYHVAFGSKEKLQIFDIWESQEAFDKFGEALMPVMEKLGLDPGPPMVEQVHNIIVG